MHVLVDCFACCVLTRGVEKGLLVASPVLACRLSNCFGLMAPTLLLCCTSKVGCIVNTWRFAGVKSVPYGYLGPPAVQHDMCFELFKNSATRIIRVQVLVRCSCLMENLIERRGLRLPTMGHRSATAVVLYCITVTKKHRTQTYTAVHTISNATRTRENKIAGPFCQV